MTHYTATIEGTSRVSPTADDVDRIMDALAAYSPSVRVTARGYVAARITLPADSLAQAAQTALAVSATALGGIVRFELMTEEEADLREGEVDVPDLISTAEAAAMLGVSQQRVRQMIEEGKLAAHRVGERSFALVRGEVAAKASRA